MTLTGEVPQVAQPGMDHTDMYGDGPVGDSPDLSRRDILLAAAAAFKDRIRLLNDKPQVGDEILGTVDGETVSLKGFELEIDGPEGNEKGFLAWGIPLKFGAVFAVAGVGAGIGLYASIRKARVRPKDVGPRASTPDGTK